MKIERQGNLSAPFLVFFHVSEEDISILMEVRHRGVVGGRLHIPRYHFASGQYAREHSNVSY